MFILAIQIWIIWQTFIASHLMESTLQLNVLFTISIVHTSAKYTYSDRCTWYTESMVVKYLNDIIEKPIWMKINFNVCSSWFCIYNVWHGKHNVCVHCINCNNCMHGTSKSKPNALHSNQIAFTNTHWNGFGWDWDHFVPIWHAFELFRGVTTHININGTIHSQIAG